MRILNTHSVPAHRPTYQRQKIFNVESFEVCSGGGLRRRTDTGRRYPLGWVRRRARGVRQLGKSLPLYCREDAAVVN